MNSPWSAADEYRDVLTRESVYMCVCVLGQGCGKSFNEQKCQSNSLDLMPLVVQHQKD